MHEDGGVPVFPNRIEFSVVDFYQRAILAFIDETK